MVASCAAEPGAGGWGSAARGFCRVPLLLPLAVGFCLASSDRIAACGASVGAEMGWDSAAPCSAGHGKSSASSEHVANFFILAGCAERESHRSGGTAHGGVQCVGMHVLGSQQLRSFTSDLRSQTGISTPHTQTKCVCLWIAQLCSCCIDLHVASRCRAEALEPLTVYQVAQL